MTPPTALLKSAKDCEKPSLKQAFQEKLSAPKAQASSNTQPSKQKGKKCTAHFGCANFAVFTEESGTLYCRDHRPKHIPVALIKTAEGKATGRNKIVDFLWQSAHHYLF